jgi:glycosyltransferase involved in cell wall biosynthesis
MRIGLIVPVMPPAPFLDQAVESALEQDPPPDEHAIVRDERGEGPAPTRAAALARLGDCDWVALLDADDAWEPGKLAAQREAIARHPDAVVCFGRATAVGDDGRPTGEVLPELPAGALGADELAPLLFESNPIPTSSALVRRDALVQAGGFAAPGRLASDWDLWLRLVADGATFVCEPRARIRYRRHAGGVTADVAALAESRLKVHEAHAHLVDEDSRRRAESRDLVLLARGRIRQRRYREAADALARADELEPLRGRERALGQLVKVPGVRSLLGRRRPYR